MLVTLVENVRANRSVITSGRGLTLNLPRVPVWVRCVGSADVAVYIAKGLNDHWTGAPAVIMEAGDTMVVSASIIRIAVVSTDDVAEIEWGEMRSANDSLDMCDTVASESGVFPENAAEYRRKLIDGMGFRRERGGE